jgi:hypothetical protein
MDVWNSTVESLPKRINIPEIESYEYVLVESFIPAGTAKSTYGLCQAASTLQSSGCLTGIETPLCGGASSIRLLKDFAAFLRLLNPTNPIKAVQKSHAAAGKGIARPLFYQSTDSLTQMGDSSI